MRAARRAPHRFSLDDLAPKPGKRLRATDAMKQVEASGVAEVGIDDLELYRLLLSPVEFKRFLNRLDKAVADHWRQVNHASWTEPELPFGSDIDAEAKHKRLMTDWCDRPDGEPFPPSWTVTTVFQIPGRLKLVAGREFTVRGVRGRLRFRHAVTTNTGDTWVDGWDASGRCHSICVDRVRTVHAKAKLHPKLGGRLR